MSETYRLPAGTKTKALRRWYEDELPIGHAFGDWSWCESVRTRIVLQRTWARGDTDILVLLIRSEQNAPPAILVGTLKEDTTDYGCEILPIERAAARASVCRKMYQFTGDLPTNGAPVTRETIKRALKIASAKGDAELSAVAADLGDPPTAEGIQNFLNWCASLEFTL